MMSFDTMIAWLPSLTKKGRWVLMSILSAIAVLDLICLYLDYAGHTGAKVLLAVLVGLVVFFIGIVVVELAMLYLVRASSFISHLRLERTFNNNLPVYHRSSVQLSLKGYSSPNFLTNWLLIEVMDAFPKNTQAKNLPVSLLMRDILDTHSGGVEIVYQLVPFDRGLGVYEGVWLRFFGLWQLFALNAHIDESYVSGQHSLKVVANFKLTTNGVLYGVAGKTAVEGTIQKRRRGLGQDFHQIRSYNEQDSIRHIDWRATSRLGRLMTKEYQDEQDQEIVFLLDASMYSRHRRYLEDDTQISHLDTMLNAMLLLSTVASAQGDASGFVSFSGVNDKVVPPKKNALPTLLNQSYDISSSLKMPDYMGAARTVMSLQKKRSLIVLLTATRSEAFDELLSAVHLMRAKHLVVVANLYEEDLLDIKNSLPNDANDARTYHSVEEHLNRQRTLKLQLDSISQVYGVHCPPSRLASLLVNRYLALKQGMRF